LKTFDARLRKTVTQVAFIRLQRQFSTEKRPVFSTVRSPLRAYVSRKTEKHGKRDFGRNHPVENTGPFPHFFQTDVVQKILVIQVFFDFSTISAAPIITTKLLIHSFSIACACARGERENEKRGNEPP